MSWPHLPVSSVIEAKVRTDGALGDDSVDSLGALERTRIIRLSAAEL